MNLERMAKVVRILTDAGVSKHSGYFDFQHDTVYLPWEEETGGVAEELEQAGCHFDSEVSSWASF